MGHKKVPIPKSVTKTAPKMEIIVPKNRELKSPKMDDSRKTPKNEKN